MFRDMLFTPHRAKAVDLKLFLEALGFVTVWGKSEKDFDSLKVLNSDREDLLQAVEREMNKTGHLPFHYLLSPETAGKGFNQEHVRFTGQLTQAVELQNVSGKFTLYLFEDGERNWVWKTYREQNLPPDVYEVTGKTVCQLKGLNGETLILFNYGRVRKHESTR